MIIKQHSFFRFFVQIIAKSLLESGPPCERQYCQLGTLDQETVQANIEDRKSLEIIYTNNNVTCTLRSEKDKIKK